MSLWLLNTGTFSNFKNEHLVYIEWGILPGDKKLHFAENSEFQKVFYLWATWSAQNSRFMKCFSLFLFISFDLNSLLLSFSLNIEASYAFLYQSFQRHVQMSTQWICSARDRWCKLSFGSLIQYVNRIWNLVPLTQVPGNSSNECGQKEWWSAVDAQTFFVPALSRWPPHT